MRNLFFTYFTFIGQCLDPPGLFIGFEKNSTHLIGKFSSGRTTVYFIAGNNYIGLFRERGVRPDLSSLFLKAFSVDAVTTLAAFGRLLQSLTTRREKLQLRTLGLLWNPLSLRVFAFGVAAR